MIPRTTAYTLRLVSRLIVTTAIVIAFTVVDAVAQRTWRAVNNGLDGATITAFGFTHDGRTLAAAATGIYRLESNDRWQLVGADIPVEAFGRGRSALVASSYDGIYRSGDNGTTWSRVSDLPRVSSFALVDTVLFAASDELHVSHDDGLTWTRLPGGPSYTIPAFLLALDDDELLVGSIFQIHKSSDRGASWEQMSSGTVVNSWVMHSSGKLVIASDSLRVSADTGRSNPWVVMGRSNNVGIASDGSIFATIDFGANGLYRSTDSGRSFTRLREGVIEKMAASPSGVIWYSSGFDIYRSKDAGASWERVNEGLHAPFVRDLKRTNDRLFALVIGPTTFAFSGLYHHSIFSSSNNGESWTRLIDSIQTIVGAFDGLLLASPSRITGTGSSMLLASNDNGITWRPLPVYTEPNSIVTDGAGTFVLATKGPLHEGGNLGHIIASTDYGQTWTSMDTAITPQLWAMTRGGRLLASMRVDGNTNLYLSTDLGATWSIVREDISVIAAAVAPDDDIYMTLKLNRGPAFPQVVVKSVDGGSSWTELHQFGGGLINDQLTLGPNGRILVNASPSIRSTDDGASWETFHGSEGTLGGPSFTYDRDGTLYATGHTGFGLQRMAIGALSRSIDDGTSWTRLSFFEMITGFVVASSNDLFVANGGYGVFRLDEVGAVATSDDARSDETISAIATRSGSYTLHVSVPSGSATRVSLVDMLGRESMILFDGEAPNEVIEIELDRFAIPSGTYIVAVRTTSGIRSRMVQIRGGRNN